MPPFIDVHCHLDFPDIYPKLDDLIEKAKSADVTYILTNGVNKRTNRIALRIAESYNEVKPCLGFYPPDAWEKESGEKFDEKGFDEELRFIRQKKGQIAAIGEIGLDYKEGSDKTLQKKVFISLIQLSKEIDKPIIVHSRKAEEDVLDILEKEHVKKVIMHCFCGKKRLIERASSLGYFFSIPTNVVRAQNIQGIVEKVPISHLFAETDSPFLSPFKEHQNEPSFVVESYKEIARIKGMTIEEVKNNIFMNYQKLFC